LASKKKTAEKKDKKGELEQGNVIKDSEAGQCFFWLILSCSQNSNHP
jgi:hypothetical protein